MYSSGYSQVSKHNREAQKRMQYRSKGKSCGYYMRIVFFFSSLIQSLIIVSLVLFLIYGKKQDSASTARIQDLEESFSRLSIETVALRLQRKNLTNLLNATLTNKARNDWDLVKIRHYSNISALIIQEYDRKLQQCTRELFMCKASPRFPCDCSHRVSNSENCNCGLFFERMKARLQLVESNFTQTVQRMRTEIDRTAKERDYINLEAIALRREKSAKEKELLFNKQKCKDEFYQSLRGVSNVSKAFLAKIESLFPAHIAFQLTCSKQREYLEQIRTNCTSLSREVEDKFQRYLDSVGEQVSDIRHENGRFKAENSLLSEEYRLCSKNRTGLISEHKQNLDKLQQKHDQDKEKLLMDKMRLNGEINVLENSVKYKRKEIEHLTQQINHLNMSCKAGIGGLGSGTSRAGTLSQPAWDSTGGGQLGKAGSSSSSLPSSGSSSSLSATGSGLKKPASNGGGLSSFGSASSSSSFSASGIDSNKPAFNARGSSTTGLSSGSSGSSPNLSSSGIGSNKPATNGLGSSSGSTGSTGKTGSDSFSWFGFGNNNQGPSKTGGTDGKSGTGKGSSTGNNYGGTGSAVGAGRTSGLGGGSVNVAQHLQDLQRIINPPGPEEKQDLSRMLG